MHYAFKYVIANEGVDTEKKYPFYGKVIMFHPADDLLRMFLTAIQLSV